MVYSAQTPSSLSLEPLNQTPLPYRGVKNSSRQVYMAKAIKLYTKARSLDRHDFLFLVTNMLVNFFDKLVRQFLNLDFQVSLLVLGN